MDIRNSLNLNKLLPPVPPYHLSNDSLPTFDPKQDDNAIGRNTARGMRHYHERTDYPELRDFSYIRQYFPAPSECTPTLVFFPSVPSYLGNGRERIRGSQPPFPCAQPIASESLKDIPLVIDIKETPRSSFSHSSINNDLKVPPRPLPVHSRLYAGRQKRANSRLGRTEVHRYQRSSRFSTTPAELPVLRGQPLSNRQEAELKRISRHGGWQSSSSIDQASKLVDEPPNGGALAWLQVLGAFICVMNAQGLNMSFGVFQAYYEFVLLPGHSPSKIAWIGSFQIFALFFSGLIVGPLIDKGHFRFCLNGGSVLLFSSLLVTSFCKSWGQLFLIQGVCTGVGMGVIFSSCVMNVTAWFSSRLGLVSGLAAAGASIGGIIFPLVASELIEKIQFGWTVRVFALINLSTMIPANLMLRPRPGWKAQGSKALDRTMFRDIPYLLMSTGMFFAYEGVFFGFYFIVTYAQTQLDGSPSGAVKLLIAMNATNILGRFVPNLISDACIGPINTLIPTTFLTACIIFLWIGTTTLPSLYVVACFYGFAAAGIQSLYAATVYSFVGPDRTKAGIRMGFVFALIGIACLTGSPLGGQLIKINDGQYLYAQLFAGITISISGCFFLAARWLKGGWSPSRL